MHAQFTFTDAINSLNNYLQWKPFAVATNALNLVALRSDDIKLFGILPTDMKCFSAYIRRKHVEDID